MSRARPVLVTIGLLLVFGASIRAQPAPVTTARTPGQAQVGEPIMVVVYTVKPDKKPQMDEYVSRFGEALRRAAASDEAVRRVMVQTRNLAPTKANGDGTWTYIFLMDPVVPGYDYDMETILAKAMPQSEVNALLKLFTDAIEPELRQVVQMTQMK